jgi:NAD(P)H-dependent FMN reductase
MKIAAICGSLRRQSYNMIILKLVVEQLKSLGHEVNIIDINDFNVPLFSQDIEESTGMPESVKKMKMIVHNAEAILIASPEYNGSFSGVLKNAIDWISRGITADESVYASFMGKPAAIMAASPGRLGGMRALMQLRHVMSSLGCNVMAKQVAVPEAHQMGEQATRDLHDLAKKFDQFVRKLT